MTDELDGKEIDTMQDFDEEDLRTVEPMVNVHASEIANY